MLRYKNPVKLKYRYTIIINQHLYKSNRNIAQDSFTSYPYFRHILQSLSFLPVFSEFTFKRLELPPLFSEHVQKKPGNPLGDFQVKYSEKDYFLRFLIIRTTSRASSTVKVTTTAAAPRAIQVK